MRLFTKFSTLITLMLLAFFAYSNAQNQKEKEADQIIGKWLTGSKEAKVDIYKKNNKFYGKIVWLKEPNEKDGTPKIDDENPDPKLQKRPIMGLLMLKDFVYDEDNEWDDGYIYDPKSGKTYSCTITLKDGGKTLKVRGYIGISLIGRTDIWTKAED